MRMLPLILAPLMISFTASAAQPPRTTDPLPVISLMAPDEVNKLHVPAHSRQEVRLHVPLETFPFLYIASIDNTPLKGRIRARRSTESDYKVTWMLDGKRHRAGYRLSGLTTTALYGDDLIFLIETDDVPINATLDFMAVTPQVYGDNTVVTNGQPTALKYLIGPRPRLRANVPKLGNVTVRSSSREPIDLQVWYYYGESIRTLGCSGPLQPGIPCTFSAPQGADHGWIHFTVEPNADANSTLTVTW